MADGLDPRDIPLQPANDLEGVMVQVAGGVRDEAELFRALAAAELLVPQAGGEGPLRELPADPGAEVALPLLAVGDVRAVAAYTSEEQLRLAPLPAWTGFLRLAGETLAAMLPRDAQIVLNPTGQLSTLVPAARLADPDLPPGVRTLDEQRPIAAGEPEVEDERSLAAVRATPRSGWCSSRAPTRATCWAPPSATCRGRSTRRSTCCRSTRAIPARWRATCSRARGRSTRGPDGATRWRPPRGRRAAPRRRARRS
jgi:hypothetical protein